MAHWWEGRGSVHVRWPTETKYASVLKMYLLLPQMFPWLSYHVCVNGGGNALTRALLIFGHQCVENANSLNITTRVAISVRSGLAPLALVKLSVKAGTMNQGCIKQHLSLINYLSNGVAAISEATFSETNQKKEKANACQRKHHLKAIFSEHLHVSTAATETAADYIILTLMPAFCWFYCDTSVIFRYHSDTGYRPSNELRFLGSLPNGLLIVTFIPAFYFHLRLKHSSPGLSSHRFQRECLRLCHRRCRRGARSGQCLLHGKTEGVQLRREAARGRGGLSHQTAPFAAGGHPPGEGHGARSDGALPS